MKNTKSKSVALMRWIGLSGVVALFFCVHGTLSAQNFTKKSTPSLPALTNAKAQWVDFNNDGRLDLFIAGLSSGGTLQTSVYINTTSAGNTTSATFNTISLTALADIAFDFGDYNNDGYIDIITSGITSGGQKKTLIYRNNSGTGFLPQGFSLAQLSKGGILWKDLDNDSDLDILITGLDDQNEENIFLYEFDNADYHLQPTDLTPVSNGQLKLFDAQRDGSPELIITGLNESGSPVTLIYSVDVDFDFQLYSGTLEGTAFNSIAAGDLDGNGYEDLIVTGLTGDDLVKKTQALRNNTVNDFTLTSTSLPNLSASSADIGDLNNDGLADIILTGQDDSQPTEFKRFKYFRNTSPFTFTDVSHSMKNIFNGDVTLGDYDNDGDLDIFQIGNSDISFEANLYASDLHLSVMNAAPSSPSNLASDPLDNLVTLSWNRPSDDHTSSNSLSFNLYLSKNEDGADLLISPMSDHTNGFRRIASEGNVGTSNTKTIRNLPEGKYYWSVQAIDNGHKASAFALEQEFSICYPVSLGADTTICYKDNLHLEMTSGPGIVNWYSKTTGLFPSSPGNTLDLEVEENDTIIVEVIRPWGCTVKDTLYVTMTPLPVIDLGSDLEICFKEQFSKVLTTSYDSVNWFNPEGLLRKDALSYSYAVTVKDTIIAQVFSAYKCVNYDSVIVDVLPLPQFSIGAGQDICYKEDVSLSVTGTWPSVNWKTLVTGAQALNTHSYSYEVLQKDTVVARVMDSRGCINYDSAIVGVLTLPEVDLGEDPSVCYDEDILLHLTTNGISNEWFDADNNSLTTNVLQYNYEHVRLPDKVIVRVVGANSCVNRDTITIHVIPLPQFNIGRDTAICFNKNILLEAGAGFQRVDWLSKSDGTTLQADSWFFNYSVEQTDELVARVESLQGCINYDTIKIDMLDLPVFSLGQDLNVCSLDSVKLFIPGNWQKVNWYTGTNIILQQNNPSYDFRLDESLTIRSEVFHLNGCVQYDTLEINMLALPEFELGTDKTYCAGDPVSMDVGNIGTSYAWENSTGNPLSNASVYSFAAASSEWIFLTVANGNQCKYRDSVYTHVNPLPVFTINGPSEICSSDEASLSVDFPWQTISWYRAPGDTLAKDVNSTSVILNVTREIFATLKDINQCVSTRSLIITVNNRPAALAGIDTLLCYGQSSIIGGTYSNENDLTFNWTPASSLDNPALARPTATPNETVTYIVKVTDSKGCSGVDSVYVEVNPEIIVDAGDHISICTGDQITLGGSPTASGSKFPYSYQWAASVGEINSVSPNPVVSPIQTTTYDVFVTTGKCEVVFDSIRVTVNPLPEVTAISDQSIGAGGDVTLSATGAVEYRWTPEESLDDPTLSSPVAAPMKTTIYTVTGTDANGCEDTAQVEVLVQNNLFIPSLFTPNGDGSNDSFKLYGSGIESISFSVFDQQGNRLYHTENVNQALEIGWDGTAKGKQLKNDIYIWTIDGNYFSGEIVRYHGKSSGIIKLMK